MGFIWTCANYVQLPRHMLYVYEYYIFLAAFCIALKFGANICLIIARILASVKISLSFTHNNCNTVLSIVGPLCMHLYIPNTLVSNTFIFHCTRVSCVHLKYRFCTCTLLVCTCILSINKY